MTMNQSVYLNFFFNIILIIRNTSVYSCCKHYKENDTNHDGHQIQKEQKVV